jgi:hypothetical protein
MWFAADLAGECRERLAEIEQLGVEIALLIEAARHARVLDPLPELRDARQRVSRQKRIAVLMLEQVIAMATTIH